MDPQAVPYVMALVVASFLSLSVSLYTWSRHPTPGAVSLTALMLSAAVYTFAYALQVASHDLSTALFWYKLSFIGAVALSPLWLIFALRYTGHDRWLTWYHGLGFFLIPLASLLLGWTNAQHHLYGSHFRMDLSGAFPMLRWERGLGFWIHATYAYTLTMIGALMMMRYALRAPSLYRGQVISLFVGALAPVVGNLIHVTMHLLDVGTLSQIDLAPFTLPVTGIAWAYALFQFRLLEVVPVARDAIIDNMEDGILVVDPAERIVDANLAMLALIDGTISDVIGKRAADRLPAWLNPTPYCREAEKQQEEISMENQGVEHHFDLRISPLHSGRGRVAGCILIVRDITQRKQAEREIERYARELQRSNQELEQFARIISHDLQEPARMVNGYLELLERRYRGQLDEKADVFIDYAADGARRMQEMIGALLDLSRVERDGRAMTETDVETLLQRTLTALGRVIEETGATVTHDPMPTVKADRAQLAQVFQNLVANGIKFRKEATPPRVHISAQRGDSRWIFSIADNGIGLDPEQADRVFQIFQRLHTREEYPGLGIGLALCKRIVERHGGRIWVESTPGEGSTFYFSLPA